VAKFTDITRQAGIQFTHVNGAYGESCSRKLWAAASLFWITTTTAPRICSSSIRLTARSRARRQTTAHARALHHNDGHGRFTDVTKGSGLEVSCYGMGLAIGDYDNDGLSDIFITAVGGNHLFHNDGHGKFHEVTLEAGVGGSTNDWSTGAAFIDYDNDGQARPLRLQLRAVVAGNRSGGQFLAAKDRSRLRSAAQFQPACFQGCITTMVAAISANVSASAGIQLTNAASGLPFTKSLAVKPVDVDNDGWIDLVVANDTVQNSLFHNETQWYVQRNRCALGHRLRRLRPHPRRDGD